MTGTKPLLLDLYCKAGGATKGYQRAGFTVHGVDIEPQPNYCGDKFIQSDALAYVAQYGWMYDAIHASPPCQAHTVLKAVHQDAAYQGKHLDLIPQTRFWLKTIGTPYIIENVVGSPLTDTITLCGTMFGLKTFRHRLFESNVLLIQPQHIPHSILGLEATKRGTSPGVESSTGIITITGHFQGTRAFAAMGVDWMSRAELAQAIPPAYTEFLGRQLMQYVLARREVA